jgi:hypothetical protein
VIGRCGPQGLVVTVLRKESIDVLRAALSGEELYDLRLAACEAASNAVEHALDPTEPFLDVRCQIGQTRVAVVVQDHGQWSDEPPGADRGRGMVMMWMLADCRVVTGPRGTTVTILSSPRHREHGFAPHVEQAVVHGTPPSSSAARGARPATATTQGSAHVVESGG